MSDFKENCWFMYLSSLIAISCHKLKFIVFELKKNPLKSYVVLVYYDMFC